MQQLCFSEFEAYNAALQDADVRLTLLRVEKSTWELDSLQVGPLHLQYGRTGSPLIGEAVADPDGLLYWVPVEGDYLINGFPIDDRMVLIVPGGADFTLAVQGKHGWVSLFVPQGLLEPPPRAPSQNRSCSRLGRPSKDRIDRLRSLVTGIFQVAVSEPGTLGESAALQSIQAELLAASRAVCGWDLAPPPTGRPLLPRDQILKTVRELIETDEAALLGVEDLAHAVDVSVRTLRSIFPEYYGISPHRYLTIRRLHQVRAALRKRDPIQATVTRVAAQFGFWQFGRFAGQYHRLFGELPSATLSQPR